MFGTTNGACRYEKSPAKDAFTLEEMIDGGRIIADPSRRRIRVKNRAGGGAATRGGFGCGGSA